MPTTGQAAPGRAGSATPALHAELGEQAAAKFLKGLELRRTSFGLGIVGSVGYITLIIERRILLDAL